VLLDMPKKLFTIADGRGTMGSLLQRSLLAAALGLGVTAGLARADKPAPGPVVSQPPTAQTQTDRVVPIPDATMTESTPVDEYPVQVKHPTLERLKSGKVCQAIASHLPLTCYGHHNDYACGSIHADLVFLFGSCRQFYGERCLKNPPASPVLGFDPYNLTFNPPGSPGYVPPPPPSNCRCR
jgi:hypothetical protein